MTVFGVGAFTEVMKLKQEWGLIRYDKRKSEHRDTREVCTQKKDHMSIQ